MKPNCRHSLSTFFPGISKVPEPVDDAQAVETYEAEQHQRYIERTIRMYRRLETGSLDDRNRERYEKKLHEWQDRMRMHMRNHPQLRRDRAREVDRTA